MDAAWAPPVVTPVSDSVISKCVLLEGERCAEVPSGAFTIPLKVPRVIRPKVIRENYGFKVDVQRGDGRVEHLWPARPSLKNSKSLPDEELGYRLGLLPDDDVIDMGPLPLPRRTTPGLDRSVSPPMTPPPRTPSPFDFDPIVPVQIPAYMYERWEAPIFAVNSYSHCFM